MAQTMPEQLPQRVFSPGRVQPANYSGPAAKPEHAKVLVQKRTTELRSDVVTLRSDVVSRCPSPFEL